jgi:tetratricopeptide (TPR) repeat protein
LQAFYKQPLEALRGADLRKKCSRLSAFDAKSQVDEALQSQACRLADGNPRLLEWLDKVLLNLDPPQPPLKRGEQNTVAEILARLEADPVELREQVLAEALLAQIDKPLEEMLRRGLVFELPVPREALAAVCESIPNLEQQINRAVALGLLEVSPDSSLRVPRILPLKLPEDAEALHKQAAEVLYRLWWEAAETSGEQGLEINRLARLGKAETIATETAVDLTRNGHQHSLFWEVVELCKLNLEVTEDYRLLHQRALAEQQLGEFEQAQKHYQQALNICPQEDKQEKAAIIYNLATLKDNQEDIKEAIALVKKSETIFESIGYDVGQAVALYLLGILEAKQGHIEEAITFHEKCDVIFDSIGGDQAKQGKAAALHCLGIHKATQGKVEEAIALYWDSVVLDESIGNVTGKAATLAELGELLASEKKDFAAALNCLQQSLDILQDIQSPKAEKVREAIARVQQMAEKRG